MKEKQCVFCDLRTDKIAELEQELIKKGVDILELKRELKISNDLLKKHKTDNDILDQEILNYKQTIDILDHVGKKLAQDLESNKEEIHMYQDEYKRLNNELERKVLLIKDMAQREVKALNELERYKVFAEEVGFYMNPVIYEKLISDLVIE